MITALDGTRRSFVGIVAFAEARQAESMAVAIARARPLFAKFTNEAILATTFLINCAHAVAVACLSICADLGGTVGTDIVFEANTLVIHTLAVHAFRPTMMLFTALALKSYVALTRTIDTHTITIAVTRALA